MKNNGFWYSLSLFWTTCRGANLVVVASLSLIAGCSTPNLEKLVEQSRASQLSGGNSAVAAVSTSPKEANAPVAPPPLPIRSLAVRIVTSDGLFSGLGDLPDIPSLPGIPKLPLVGNLIAKSDNVWVDLGPRTWELGHAFPAGKTFTSSLDISGPTIFVEDIDQVRLEKKGVLGFCNTPDSFLYGVGPLPSVADIVATLRKTVQEQLYADALLQGALGNKNAAVKAATDQYKAISRAVTDLNNQIADLASKINSISDVQAQLDKLEDKLAHIAEKIPGVGKIIKRLLKEKEELTKRLNDLKSHTRDWTIQKAKLAADLQVKVTEQAAIFQTKVAAEVAYAAVKAQLDAEQAVLRKEQQGLVVLEALAQKLPSLKLPSYGQWKPASITVIVNGQEGPTYQIGETLKQGQYSWEMPLGNMTPAERFLHGLRSTPAIQTGTEQTKAWSDILHHPDIVTTAFKNADISGWEYYPKNLPHVPVRNARVIGHLVHPPSEGTDANVSLDLEVEAADVGGRQFVLNDQNGFHQPRFIRIEYQFGQNQRYRNWHLGDRFEVTGPVRWDTDQGGFFEIHPTSAGSVRVLSRLK